MKLEEVTMTMLMPGKKWRHADGGIYEIKTITGQIRQGSNPWAPVVGYDHADGTQSFGPYYTDLPFFLERFTYERID